MRTLSLAVAAGTCLSLVLVSTNTSAGADFGSASQPTRAPAGQASDTIVPFTDIIQRLQAKIDSGRVAFPFDSVRGYLPALLRALRIPPSSQSLVFSRTSLQTDLIAPWSPRALYFNDDVYIGFVPESNFLEIAAVSATTGAVFYTLNQDGTAKPKFKHETTSCLMCHKSPAATSGVAGFTMLSTLADDDGYAIASVHTGATTDATPLEKRFGGWYVTGMLGAARHAGNVRSPLKYADIADKDEYRKSFMKTAGSNRTELSQLIQMQRYLETSSDVVALMVLVHQTSVHNLITVVHTAALKALNEDAVVRGYLGEDGKAPPLESTNARFRVAVNQLVRAMLFIDEAPLNGKVQGTSTFAKDFGNEGPRDTQGRSLREFDLQQRMFKYPLSFLIYSESFDELPLAGRYAVYRRLETILEGNNPDPEYVRLSQADRKNILDILVATKPEFAAKAWR